MENLEPQKDREPVAKASRKSIILFALSFVLLFAAVLFFCFALDRYRRANEQLGEITLMIKRYESTVATEGTPVGAAAVAAPSVAEIAICDANYKKLAAGSAISFCDVGENSFLVTNHHVVENAEKIMVITPDGSRIEAILWGYDYQADIAVLRIAKNSSLVPARIGYSSNLGLGQTIITIGNPTGSLPGTLGIGIISNLSRNVVVNGDHSIRMLQIDAAISKGSSGGGLFDMEGNLIGILSAKAASPDSENIGFAIPIDQVFDLFEDVLELHTDGTDNSLGIELDANCRILSYAYAEELAGTVKTEMGVELDYALLPDDQLLYIDGYSIKSIEDYNAAVARVRVGQRVTVVVRRTYTVAGSTQQYASDIAIDITAHTLNATEWQ